MILPQNSLWKIEAIRWAFPNFFLIAALELIAICSRLYCFPSTFRKKESLFLVEDNYFTYSLHPILSCLFNEFTPSIFAPFSYTFKISLISESFKFPVFLCLEASLDPTCLSFTALFFWVSCSLSQLISWQILSIHMVFSSKVYSHSLRVEYGEGG